MNIFKINYITILGSYVWNPQISNNVWNTIYMM